MIDLRSFHKRSSKVQEVKKTAKTQGNNVPQATAEVSSTGIRLRPAPNVTTTANESETSRRSTANNSVSIAMASKSPVPKLKPDFISIKTADGDLSASGDEDQREREEMLASPVKGSDAQTASMVSQITFFDRIFTMTSLPLCKALVKLEKTNDEKPRNRSKAELLQLKKEDLIIWNNTLEPNYIKYYLSTEKIWTADAKLLDVAQLLYNETLRSKTRKQMIFTPSSGPVKLVKYRLFFFRVSLTIS